MIDSRPFRQLASMLARILPSGIIIVVLSLLLATHPAEAASPHVDIMQLNGNINAASLHLLTNSLDQAKQDGARALVIEVDTPGGDITSMNAMTKAELGSSVPIIAYVSPTGGRAASAGAFVTLAAQVAAMAPTTRIGASSPVTGSGGEISPTLKQKIVNDLVASIRGIQQRYGRDVDLAEAMVTKAAAYDDVTAVRRQIVDLGAPNLNALLNAVNGRVVTMDFGVSLPLRTADVVVQPPAAADLGGGGEVVGPGLQTWPFYLLGAVVLVMISFAFVSSGISMRHRRILTGVETMIGARVIAITPLGPEGRVNYAGENWAAYLDVPSLSVKAGTELRIIAVEGLRLRVQPWRSYSDNNDIHSSSYAD